MSEQKTQIPAAVRKYFAIQGRKGGKRGSREDKSRAGKLGHAAMVAKLAQQAPEPEPAPTETPATNSQ